LFLFSLYFVLATIAPDVATDNTAPRSVADHDDITTVHVIDKMAEKTEGVEKALYL